ncbi:putative quinol monooxygenase [Amaricoccus sp. W119]|uniref:putative quinol monooxygenase n=1 Tax=Amaricoccus sp. W119 TaxID=3391833 RepID=UPI0039A5B181
MLAVNTADLPRPAYVITVLFDLEDGAFEGFHRLVRDNAEESLRVEPGCRRFDVLTPTGAEAGRQVLLYEIYDSRADFELHLASAHFRLFDERTRAMVRRKTVTEFVLSEDRDAVLP